MLTQPKTYQQHAQPPKNGTNKAKRLGGLPAITIIIRVAIRIAVPIEQHAEGGKPRCHHDKVPHVVDHGHGEGQEQQDGRDGRQRGDDQRVDDLWLRRGGGVLALHEAFEPGHEAEHDLESVLVRMVRRRGGLRGLTMAQTNWPARRTMLRRRAPSILTVN
jgi:hypothetical protein